MRFIGGLLVCASCALLGLYMGERGVRRADLLLEFKHTLLLLKSEIIYAIQPLPQAFESIANKTHGPFAEFYADIAGMLTKKQTPLEEAWKIAADKLCQTSLAKTDIGLMGGLGRSLGKIDADIQLAAIDMLVIELDSIVSRLNADNAKNVKMYRSLGILGGLLITVVLL